MFKVIIFNPLVFNPLHAYSIIKYDDIITSNEGIQTKIETLTADIYRAGLNVLNVKGGLKV